MTVSRSQQIRNWLATQDGARTPGEIAAGINATRRHHVADTIQQMTKDGYLVREKGETCWRYAIGKPLIRTRRLSTEEQRRKKNKAERDKAQANGRRSWAQYLADLAEQRQQRAIDLAVAKERRRERRAKPMHDRVVRQHTTVASITGRIQLEQAAAKPPAETVDQWMARTGLKPQVLPMGAMSKPLTACHRDDSCWQRSRQAA